MLLSIDHRTEYAAGMPAADRVQYVRLTPRDDPSQHTLRWNVGMPGRAVPWRDAFGNMVQCVVRRDPHHALTLCVNGEVDTVETHGIVPLESDGLPPGTYLRPTPLTSADSAIRDFALPAEKMRGKGDLAALHALMAHLHDAIEPATGESIRETPAADILRRGTGDYRDQAHLFIACCRAWGIPARYVSGYLHTGSAEDGPSRLHGWAEALVEYLGWVSFDPSNRQSATPAYVRLAVGFDYHGAAPVRGAHRIAGTKNGAALIGDLAAQ